MNIQFCLQHKLLYAVTVDSDNVPRKIHYSTPGSLCPALHPRSQKNNQSVRYSCHICGDTGHKIIDCPKYNDMQQKVSVHDTNICALVATWVSYVLDIQLTSISSIFPLPAIGRWASSHQDRDWMSAIGAYGGHYPLQDLSLICTSPELILDLKNTSATSHCALVEENISVLSFPFYLTDVFTV
jgi:hypothetical protein